VARVLREDGLYLANCAAPPGSGMLADDVATLLVDGLLDDRPDGAASRVLAIVNGLGSCSYEELFVTYRSVARRLREADLEIVEAQVGEHATSLDMGGMSVTLVWLDEELERYWFAPCDSPAFIRGGIEAEPLAESATETVDLSVQVTTPGSAASQAGAREVARGLGAVARMLSANRKHLGDLDAVAGDGDHGTGMERGALAAQETVERLVADSAGCVRPWSAPVTPGPTAPAVPPGRCGAPC